MYEYWVSLKSARHWLEHCGFNFYSRCVIFFFKMTKIIGCTWTKRSFGKASDHAVCAVSQNLSVEFLNQFYILLHRKYASFGHSAFFRNH